MPQILPPEPQGLNPKPMVLGGPRDVLGSFRKLGVPYFGVLITRILLFRLLYWGPLFSETATWCLGLAGDTWVFLCVDYQVFCRLLSYGMLTQRAHGIVLPLRQQSSLNPRSVIRRPTICARQPNSHAYPEYLHDLSLIFANITFSVGRWSA